MPRLETVKNSNVFSWGEAYFELCSERPLGLMPSISNTTPTATSEGEQNGCRQRLEGYLSCHRRIPLAVA